MSLIKDKIPFLRLDITECESINDLISEVALFAKKHSQYAAAKIFNVARRRIFDWMRQIPKLEELIAKGHMKKMTGRGPKNRDIDQALYNWYCERSVKTTQTTVR